jgi:hypothetical protein
MQFQDLRDLVNHPYGVFARLGLPEVVVDGIIYPLSTKSPINEDMTLFRAISDRHSRLERYEQALTRDPNHLQHRLH